jgi:hypothetical protein
MLHATRSDSDARRGLAESEPSGTRWSHGAQRPGPATEEGLDWISKSVGMQDKRKTLDGVGFGLVFDWNNPSPCMARGATLIRSKLGPGNVHTQYIREGQRQDNLQSLEYLDPPWSDSASRVCTHSDDRKALSDKRDGKVYFSLLPTAANT